MMARFMRYWTVSMLTHEVLDEATCSMSVVARPSWAARGDFTVGGSCW